MLTDPLADLLTCIRNSQMAKHQTLSLPYSRLKEAVVKIIVEEGYLAGYKVSGKKPRLTLDISLKYQKRRPALTSLTRISKPGARFYAGKADLFRLQRGRGITILSTSQGVITAKKAQKLNLGGEVLCRVL